MICPECSSVMITDGTPFLKKTNGEKKYFVSFVCESCGFVLDEPTRISKHDRRSKEL